MVKRVAVVRRGVVENVVLVDEDQQWRPDGRPTLVDLPDDSHVGPGWKYRKGTFIAPPPPQQ